MTLLFVVGDEEATAKTTGDPCGVTNQTATAKPKTKTKTGDGKDR
jgi:high-affinity K+ transport system ATPase subunit B